MDFTEAIVNVSNEATQEMGLEELMAKVQNKVIYKYNAINIKYSIINLLNLYHFYNITHRIIFIL